MGRERRNIRLSYVAEFERCLRAWTHYDLHTMKQRVAEWGNSLPALLSREFKLAEFYDFPRAWNVAIEDGAYEDEDMSEDVETDDGSYEDVVRGGRRVSTISVSAGDDEAAGWEKGDHNRSDYRADSIFYSKQPWRHEAKIIGKCFFCGTLFGGTAARKYCPAPSRCRQDYFEAWKENEARHSKENQCQPLLTKHLELEQELL